MKKFFEDYADNPLDLDFDDASNSTAGNNTTSGNQGTPQLLTLDELDKVDTLVDQTWGLHSADPKLIISKAVRLSKNGYSLVNYSYECVHSSRDIWEKSIRLSTVEEVKKYGILRYNRGYKYSQENYVFLREYVDRKNKVYYFCFGRQRHSESMWC